MKEELNELYRKVLHGAARPGEKESLARWMAGLSVDREEISPEALEAEREQSRRELQDRFFHQRKNITFIRPWLIAASVAALIICTVMFFNIHPKQTEVTYAGISTKAGERKVITLADGSKIWMNSASSVRYPLSFNNGPREIFLDGEAYFDVSHDQNHPFMVHAGKLTVQVLGTTFDVRNYPDDADASVTVASGKVAVKTPATARYRTLTPGGQLTYNKETGTADQHNVDPADHIAWQKGTQVYRNKELREICKLLERSYDVKVHIRTPALETRKINFRIKGGENITQVMEMLSATGDFRYEEKDRNIILWK